MRTDLKRDVALVTGASGGLGRHFAQILADAGARVALTGRRVERLTEVRDQIRANGGAAESFLLDITAPSRIPHLLDEVERSLGPVDVLLNNAGMSLAGAPSKPCLF
jgi:NADP-dependent 3-hydroxy acid dehydrogenase YdfG